MTHHYRPQKLNSTHSLVALHLAIITANFDLHCTLLKWLKGSFVEEMILMINIDQK